MNLGNGVKHQDEGFVTPMRPTQDRDVQIENVSKRSRIIYFLFQSLPSVLGLITYPLNLVLLTARGALSPFLSLRRSFSLFQQVFWKKNKVSKMPTRNFSLKSYLTPKMLYWKWMSDRSEYGGHISKIEAIQKYLSLLSFF